MEVLFAPPPPPPPAPRRSAPPSSSPSNTTTTLQQPRRAGTIFFTALYDSAATEINAANFLPSQHRRDATPRRPPSLRPSQLYCIFGKEKQEGNGPIEPACEKGMYVVLASKGLHRATFAKVGPKFLNPFFRSGSLFSVFLVFFF